MTDNAFNFKSAPNTGNRQFGALAAVLAGRGSTSPKGLNARDQSKLMAQQAGHNIDQAIVKGMVDTDVASNASRNKMAENRAGARDTRRTARSAARSTESAAASAHQRDEASAGNTRAHELTVSAQSHTQSMEAANNVHSNAISAIEGFATNPSVSSMKTPGGASATFNRSPQFGGIGSDTSNESPTKLD